MAVRGDDWHVDFGEGDSRREAALDVGGVGTEVPGRGVGPFPLSHVIAAEVTAQPELLCEDLAAGKGHSNFGSVCRLPEGRLGVLRILLEVMDRREVAVRGAGSHLVSFERHGHLDVLEFNAAGAIGIRYRFKHRLLWLLGFLGAAQEFNVGDFLLVHGRHGRFVALVAVVGRHRGDIQDGTDSDQGPATQTSLASLDVSTKGKVYGRIECDVSLGRFVDRSVSDQQGSPLVALFLLVVTCRWIFPRSPVVQETGNVIILVAGRTVNVFFVHSGCVPLREDLCACRGEGVAPKLGVLMLIFRVVECEQAKGGNLS